MMMKTCGDGGVARGWYVGLLVLILFSCTPPTADNDTSGTRRSATGDPPLNGKTRPSNPPIRVDSAATDATPPAWWRGEHIEIESEMQAGGMGAGAGEAQAREAAVTAARRSLAEVRRVSIQAELQVEAASEVRQGAVYEAHRIADRMASYVAATLGETRVNRIETRPYRDGDEVGVLAWAHVCIPIERLHPHRRLQALLARRPAPSRDEPALATWLRNVAALGDAYRAEGEAALAQQVLRLLVAQRGEAADYLELAEYYASQGQIAGAVSTLEGLQARLASEALENSNDLRLLLTSRLAELRPRMRTWEALTNDLLGRFDRHANESRLRLLPISGRHLRVNVGSPIAIATDEPRVVALFWLDVAGLYRWDWRGAAPMIEGQRTLTTTSDTAGQLTILAVAAPTALPAFMRTRLPVEAAAVKAGNLEAIAAFEEFLAEIDEWTALPDATIALLRLHVVE